MKATELDITFSSEAELKNWGAALGALLSPGMMMGFDGPLGAGKTTLIRALLGGVEGQQPRFVIQSPTFGLMHEYPSRIPCVHVDCYRLEGKNPREVEHALENVGFRDYVTSQSLVLIEWFERLPKKSYRAHLHLILAFGTETLPQQRHLHLIVADSTPPPVKDFLLRRG